MAGTAAGSVRAAGAKREKAKPAAGGPRFLLEGSSGRGKSLLQSLPPGEGGTGKQAATGWRAGEGHAERGPANWGTPSWRKRKGGPCPRLGSQAGPRESNKKKKRPVRLNAKKFSEKIGQKQISSPPPRGV